jgi:hypothetical protein
MAVKRKESNMQGTYTQIGNEQKRYDRVRFGQESESWGDDSCGDCGCKVGELHAENCDVERCPACSGQLLSCDCDLPSWYV